jgi:hypothetical protein
MRIDLFPTLSAASHRRSQDDDVDKKLEWTLSSGSPLKWVHMHVVP